MRKDEKSRWRMTISCLSRRNAGEQDSSLSRSHSHPSRTWDLLTFSLFWFSAVGTVANWLGGGSFLTFGITVWDGILVSRTTCARDH